MCENYFKATGIFTNTYYYIDYNQYEIERLLYPEMRKNVKYLFDMHNEVSNFIITVVKVKKKNCKQFEKILKELDKNLTSLFREDYTNFIVFMYNIIAQGNITVKM